MAKTAEKNLWNSMRTAMKVFGPKIHYTRIENSVSDSFPDVEIQLSVAGSSFNSVIELKTAGRPVHFETPVAVKIRPGQVRWLGKRWKVGGNAWVLIQVGSGHELARFLVPGHLAAEVSEGRTEKWLEDHSMCHPKTPLEDIVKMSCIERWLD